MEGRSSSQKNKERRLHHRLVEEQPNNNDKSSNNNLDEKLESWPHYARTNDPNYQFGLLLVDVQNFGKE